MDVLIQVTKNKGEKQKKLENYLILSEQITLKCVSDNEEERENTVNLM
jgi:hypothetical protein